MTAANVYQQRPTTGAKAESSLHHADLASLVGDCNPAWDAPGAEDQGAEDAAFLEAVALVEAVLRRLAAR